MILNIFVLDSMKKFNQNMCRPKSYIKSVTKLKIKLHAILIRNKSIIFNLQPHLIRQNLLKFK